MDHQQHTIYTGGGTTTSTTAATTSGGIGAASVAVGGSGDAFPRILLPQQASIAAAAATATASSSVSPPSTATSSGTTTSASVSPPGGAVRSPIAFPAPRIVRSALIRVRVLLDDGRIVEKNAVHSESGALYVLDRDIKRAIYGRVMLGYPVLINEAGLFRKSGTNVAIKVITEANLRQFHGISQEDPIKEMSALDFIGHHVPSIVPPFTPSYIPQISHINVTHMLECNTDESYVFMVLEYIDGLELFDYMDRRQRLGLDEASARRVFTDIVRGMSVLHGMGICHRDMSMENVMVTNDLSRAVIIDLGMALRVERNPITGEFYPFPNPGQCGKAAYMAPEVVANVSPYDGAAADIWALGIILFALLAGFPPLEIASVTDPRYRRVMNGRLGSMIREWQLPINDDAVNLISGILRPIPLNRLTLDQILAHTWMNVPEDVSGIPDFPLADMDTL